MRTAALALCLTGELLVSQMHAGTITGTVSAKGAADNAAAGAGGGYQSRRYKFVEKVDYSQLQDFVVYIDQPVAGAVAKPEEEPRVVQKDAAFEPHVLPVAVGTTVRWPNEDDIYHNVFSMAGEGFDLGLYTKEKVPGVLFDKLGRVDVFCSIHSKMHCIVFVVPNAFFSKTDAKGRYAIRGLPAGTYKVKAWHERLPARTLEVVVPENGDVKLDIELGLGELPKR